MPRQYNQPYGNNKLKIKKDINSRKKSVETLAFFEESVIKLQENAKKRIKDRKASDFIRKGSMSTITSDIDIGSLGMTPGTKDERSSVTQKSRVAESRNVKTMDENLLSDKWNRKYAEKLVLKGPKGIKQMNQGTSFLVAPMYTGKPEIS